MNRIDELCKKTRSENVLMRTDTPCGYSLFELSMVLESCKSCSAYRVHRNEGYCLQPSTVFIKKGYANYNSIAEKL